MFIDLILKGAPVMIPIILGSIVALERCEETVRPIADPFKIGILDR